MPPKKYTLPSELPDGWILTDSDKKRWRIGKIIGKGGFGLIYLASGDVLVPVRDDADFVIKVEYHENGPLFSELKFYQRAAKPDTMNKWKKSKCLEFLGIPTYWGSGLSEYNGTRYRFMVMDRLGTDLQKVIGENGGQLRKPTALRLGVLMLDVLEYIHDNEYVHADIKAANLLLGHRDPNNVYLADYGLSYRYCPNGQHKEYKENPKKGHNGTIEYTSIDAHKGVVPSRRGDLEVLGYCLLHWQCGTLPWWSFLRNPAKVQEEKAKLMSNLPDSVTSMSTSDSTTEELNEESCADFNQHYEEIANFLLYVKELDYNAKPDYQILRQVLSGPGMLELLDLSRPRRPDTSRPVTQRTRSQPKRTEKTARSKPVATLEEDYEEDLSRSNIVRSRMTRETHEQKPPRFNTAAKGRPRQRSAFMDSDEDSNDEEASLPPRAHSKTRAGARQRQTLQQERRKAEFYGEAWITEDRRNKCEHQTGYTRGLNDDCVEVGNYRRKHNWDYNRWEEPDYSEDPWRSSACQWENEQVPYNNRETDYLGKPAKCAKRGIRSTKGKWILIVLFVVLFTAVGIVLRLRLLK